MRNENIKNINKYNNLIENNMKIHDIDEQKEKEVQKNIKFF